MIVESMTLQEISAALKKDLDENENRINKKMDDFCSIAVKTNRRKFPLIKVFEFESKQKITYLIIARANKRSSWNMPEMITAGYYVVNKEFYGFLATQTVDPSVVFSRNRMNKKGITLFTPHFLQRYKERYLKDISCSSKEAFIEFITRNNDGMSRNITTKHLTKCNEHDYEGYAQNVLLYQHGISIVEKHIGGLIVNKTFLSYEMLKNEQIEIFEEDKKHHEKLRELLKDYCT